VSPVTVAHMRATMKKISWKIDVDSLKDDAPLSEQGLDSLDMVNLLLTMEEEYAVSIPDEALPELATLNDIRGYINGKSS
jgi:acyl carrier protein